MQCSQIIADRRTTKVLAPLDAPLPTPSGSERSVMSAMMEAGHHAPHHFPCDATHREGPMDSEVPWRFHALTGKTCRELLTRVKGLDGAVDTTVRLLGAADGLILVTWLPEPPADPAVGAGATPGLFEGTQRNMEHIAAGAAAIQSMLLVATEAAVRTFWCSGGPILGSSTVRTMLGVAPTEVLLGAVFLSAGATGDAAVKPGARRELRGPVESATRWVSL